MSTDNNYIVSTTVFVGPSLTFTQCDDSLSIVSQLMANERSLVLLNLPCSVFFGTLDSLSTYMGLISWIAIFIVYLVPKITQRQWPWPPQNFAHPGVFK